MEAICFSPHVNILQVQIHIGDLIPGTRLLIMHTLSTKMMKVATAWV